MSNNLIKEIEDLKKEIKKIKESLQKRQNEDITDCNGCEIKEICPKHHEKCAISGYEADYKNIVAIFVKRIELLEIQNKRIEKVESVLKRYLKNFVKNAKKYMDKTQREIAGVNEVEELLKELKKIKEETQDGINQIEKIFNLKKG